MSPLAVMRFLTAVRSVSLCRNVRVYHEERAGLGNCAGGRRHRALPLRLGVHMLCRCWVAYVGTLASKGNDSGSGK